MANRRRQITSVALIVVVISILFVWEKISNGSDATIYTEPVLLEENQVQVYFSPHGGCQDAIVSIIDEAESTIDCAIYTFTSRDIAQALVRAHQRGVEIRIIADRTQAADGYSKKRYLVNKEISLRVHTGEGIMHNKFMIVDSTIVLTGSYNWTASANHRNYENILIINSPALAMNYEKEFGILWKKFE